MRSKIALLMLVCSLLFALPVMAQDADPEPTDQPTTFEELQEMINSGELTAEEIQALIEQLTVVEPLQPTATPLPPTATSAPLDEVQATLEDEAAAAIISGGEATSDPEEATQDDDAARGLTIFLLVIGSAIVGGIMMAGREGGI